MQNNYRTEIFKYLRYWYLFLIVLIISFIAAKVKIRYSDKLFGIKSLIQLNTDQSSAMNSELSLFSERSYFRNFGSKIDDESKVITSRTLINKTINDNNFQINYFVEGIVKKTDLYHSSPIEVLTNKSMKTTLNIFIEDKNNFIYNNKKYQFGSQIKKGNGVLKIISKKNIKKYIGKDVIVEIDHLTSNALQYQKKLSINVFDKRSNLLEINFVENNEQKGIDFVNGLIRNFNDDYINDKKLISIKTRDFVVDRLDKITKDLESVENESQNYKQSKDIVEYDWDGMQSLGNVNDLTKEFVKLETDLIISKEIKKSLENPNSDELFPSNLLPSIISESLVNKLNFLKTEKIRISQSGNDENPIIININKQIKDITNSLLETLIINESNLSLKKQRINQQLYLNSGKTSLFPSHKNVLDKYSRNEEVISTLYSYLLQKREEVEISLNSVAPKVKIVDSAYSVGKVSPNTQLIYMIYMFLGFGLTFAFVYIKNLLDNKIHNKNDLKLIEEIPFLGTIPFSKDDFKEILNKNSRSSTAEAIRILITNIEFLFYNKIENQAKVICVTSTIPKEGKSFVASNLSVLLAEYNHKVLIIGLDLRNPKLSDYFDIDPDIGLTNFLIKNEKNIDHYIQKCQGLDNLSILASGIIPPNPTEIIKSAKFNETINDLKSQYDYIIIDTAPSSLVTDTILLNKYADVNLYVVRAHYLDKELLNLPKDLFVNKKLTNMAVILNQTNTNAGYGNGYGYGYGYGYGQDSKKTTIIERIKNLF